MAYRGDLTAFHTISSLISKVTSEETVARARACVSERGREGGNDHSQCACAGAVLRCGGRGAGDTQLERWRGTRPERKESWLAVGGLEAYRVEEEEEEKIR